ncbi:unnamed protein product [Anisakis simplex]|uniref:UPF0528 protein (inferred by orthology to a C. elegans protein) n=1 Tax=Anisakis simplex TaxID=6269 RepID=A0A0M3KA23_ANISI|nr:unnamed protein product [Anisakis simplex]
MDCEASTENEQQKQCADGGGKKRRSLKDFAPFQDGYEFVFVDQKHYEAVGEAVTEQLYQILQEPPYSLCKTYIGDPNEDTNKRCFVFHSEDFLTNKHLVVLIHGSGVVRAGQWSRRLIMNESLDRGAQLPYVRECMERGWAVLLMNTNLNKFVDEKGEEKPLNASETPVQHGLSVWKELISKSSAEYIAVVAHSAGGFVISTIMEEPACWPSRDLEEGSRRVRCICLTDSFFKVRAFEENPEKRRPHVRHWIASPIDKVGQMIGTSKNDTRCDPYVECVASGTRIHEETSTVAMSDIFKYIENSFKNDS